MNDAIKATSEELNIPEETIIQVLKAHKRNKSRLKQERDKLRLRAIREKTIREAKEGNPHLCFCKENGLKPNHDPEQDKMIRRKKRTPGYMLPVYECQLCKKEWSKLFFVAFA